LLQLLHGQPFDSVGVQIVVLAGLGLLLVAYYYNRHYRHSFQDKKYAQLRADSDSVQPL
jgi:hypothetical protein